MAIPRLRRGGGTFDRLADEELMGSVHPDDAREVLLTAEPNGGSRRPTSPPILAARLS